MNQIRNFKDRGLLCCNACNQLKNHCKCHPVTRDLHYRHLTEIMYKVRPEWIKNGMVKI